jgi:hypothetical protein
MSFDIKRIQRWKTGRTGSKETEKTQSKDLPLDHQLSFNPGPDEQWSFKGGHVFINDIDVEELINKNGNDISLLSGLSFSLDMYREHVWGLGGKLHAKFNGAIAALQGKVIGRLGSIYEGLTGGLRYEYADGDFWINNINVQAVVALYRLRPTVKARTYLKGIRDKLFLIIARKQSSPRSEGIYEVISKLIEDIDGALELHTPSDIPLLVADNRSEHECVD